MTENIFGSRTVCPIGRQLNRRGILVVLVPAVALLVSCFSIHRTLDSTVFYDGPYFKLRIERRYDRQYTIVIDEISNTFVVQCSSAATKNGRKTRWVDLASGSPGGVRTAKELIDREAGNYRIIDDRTLAWTGSSVGVTFDGCGTFAYWGPLMLPAEVIDPAPKPEYCSQPRVDCRGYDFMGDRYPRYEDLQVEKDGKITFVVRSKAFKGVDALSIRSDDYGRTWTVTPR